MTSRGNGGSSCSSRTAADAPTAAELPHSPNGAGGPASYSRTGRFGRAVGVDGDDEHDPLTQWMQHRHQAFSDFQRSLQPSAFLPSFQPFFGTSPSPLVALPSHANRSSAGLGFPSSLSAADRGRYADENDDGDNDYTYIDYDEVGGGGGSNSSSSPYLLSSRSSHNASGGRSNTNVNNDHTTPNTMLSSRDNQDLSPKARVSYDEGKFQVEFDVQDYRPEELSIKTEGDVLIVLAKHETKTENGGSFVSKQFEQRFSLPSGVKPESISSALSKDGVLIVSAPRDVPQRAAAISTDVFGSKNRSALESSNSSGAVYAHSADKEEGLPHPKVKYDDDKFQISLDCQHYKPEELDVKVEGNSIIITAKQEVKESGGTRTRVFEQKFTLPSGVRGDKVSSTFTKDGQLNISAPRSNAPASSSSLSREAIEDRMDRVMAPSAWEDDFKRHDSNSLLSSSNLSSNRRDDNLKHSSIFDHPIRRSDQTSDRFFSTSSSPVVAGASDGISRVQYDDDTYKILIDAKEFKPEELIIKTVGNTVQFEAKHEEKTSDGHSYTSRNISQSFSLPRGVDPEMVKSSLAKDGTLVISAPLPPALKTQHSSERMVPIKHH